MFLKAKINLMSGVVIGSVAVIIMKQMCKLKRRKKHEETHAPIATSD